MKHVDPSKFERVSVVFEKRPDGGLRVSSPEVPGFRLSHSDPALVTSDIIPALETIIGEMVGRPVTVRMQDPKLVLPQGAASQTAVLFTSKLAA